MERNTTIRLSAKDVVRKNLVIETEYYPLIKEQFELLVNGQSRWKDYGSKFFWASITLLIRIIANMHSHYHCVSQKTNGKHFAKYTDKRYRYYVYCHLYNSSNRMSFII